MTQPGVSDILVHLFKTFWFPREKEINQIRILREHHISIKSSIQNNKKEYTEVYPSLDEEIIDVKQEILERHQNIHHKIRAERYLNDGYDIKPIENEVLDDINNLLGAIQNRELRLIRYTYVFRACIILIFLVVLFKTIR